MTHTGFDTVGPPRKCATRDGTAAATVACVCANTNAATVGAKDLALVCAIGKYCVTDIKGTPSSNSAIAALAYKKAECWDKDTDSGNSNDYPYCASRDGSTKNLVQCYIKNRHGGQSGSTCNVNKYCLADRKNSGTDTGYWDPKIMNQACSSSYSSSYPGCHGYTISSNTITYSSTCAADPVPSTCSIGGDW